MWSMNFPKHVDLTPSAILQADKHIWGRLESEVGGVTSSFDKFEHLNHFVSAQYLYQYEQPLLIIGWSYLRFPGCGHQYVELILFH